jgi:hypothetical protein
LPFQNKTVTISFDENVTESNANSGTKKDENISLPPSTKNKDAKSTQRHRFARSNKLDLMNSIRRGPDRKRRSYKWGDEEDDDQEWSTELRLAQNRMRE